jgi:hypothetical protein
LKGSAHADAMTAGYLRTEWECPECDIEVIQDDEGTPQCRLCDEYAVPVMVTKYGRFRQ